MKTLALAVALMIAASTAGAQRPWVGLDLGATHVSMRNSFNSTSQVSAATGMELRGRVGWRWLSVAIARDAFDHEDEDERATLASRAWSIDPRVDVGLWRRLGVFGEARFAELHQHVDGFLFGTPFEGKSEGTFRGFGGGVRFAVRRGVGVEIALTRARVTMGNLLVDGFDVGFEPEGKQDLLTTRFGVSMRWP